MPTSKLIEYLVGVGQTAAWDRLSDLHVEFPEVAGGRVLREAPQAWRDTGDGLAPSERVALIKALVHLEERPGFACGSASPVIWLFRQLPEAMQEAPDLVDWILRNSTNVYLPFGSMHGRVTPWRSFGRKS